MSAFLQHPVIRRARTAFRWCRMIVWLLLLVAVTVLAYLHLIGLPGFIKRPMLQRLFDKGLQAEFSNMQLGWERGPSVIIENAAFSHPLQPLSPRLTADRAEVALRWQALTHGQIQLLSLNVEGAELKLPVSETNSDALALENVALDMRFHSNDVVRIDRCQGTFHDIRVDFLATVNHASDLQHWEFPSARHHNAIDWQSSLRRITDMVNQIHFSGRPLLQIEAGADGQNINSAHAEMHFEANGADTPWGEATNFVVQAACARLMTPGVQPFLQVEFSAAGVSTPWAGGRKLNFSASFSRDAKSDCEARLRLDASSFARPPDFTGSNWFRGEGLSCDGMVTLTTSNYVPLNATATLRAMGVQTPLGSVDRVSLEGQAAPAKNMLSSASAWGPWTKIAGWKLSGLLDARHLKSPKLHIDHLGFAVDWRAPEIVIRNFRGELYDGKAAASGVLDVQSRELRVSGKTDFDPQSISPLLHRSERAWLAQLGWKIPPKVTAGLRVVLPPWTNRPANWGAEVNASLQIGGDFTVGAASFQQAPLSSAAGHVTFTNGNWHVSHLHITRPDGEADLDYQSDAHTLEYRFLIDSRLDPRDIIPIASPRHPHLLDGFSFPQSPVIHAELSGCWRAPQQTALKATVRAANFVARGQAVSAFSADVNYTNRVLAAANVYLAGGHSQVKAPLLQVNFDTKMVMVTNASGYVDPPALQQILNRNPPLFLNYVHFDSPPSVSVSGSFSLANGHANNLHFLATCQGVHFTNLMADRASGTVDWIGNTLTVTNIYSSLYHGGTLMGWITFDSGPGRRSDFAADFTTRDIDLSALAHGLSGKTNRLEGKLDGDIGLVATDTADKSDWHGQGHIHVHDALLWDIKLFGLLSPVLNAIAPGWGHSRAREATANFVITNGAISSDDLVVRSSGFRLNFRGRIDQDKKIKARLEAILARDAPLVGPLLSFAFTPLSKLFEYHITGTVQDPVLEPVFVPRFILYLLHPFKSLKGSASPSASPTPTGKK